MSTGEAIALPAQTRVRLEDLLRQREQLSALIEVTVQTARETLDVPQGWIIRDVAAGFVPQQEPDGNAHGSAG